MSNDLSGLNLSMMSEEDLRIQVAATITSRSDQSALKDQEEVQAAWRMLQDQEDAVSRLEAALEEAKRTHAVEGLVVLGTQVRDEKASDTDNNNTNSGQGTSAPLSVGQLQFQLARARRELTRASAALDDAQKRADERQKTRYEQARQRELAEAQRETRQRWAPTIPAQTAFAIQRSGNVSGGVPMRAQPRATANSAPSVADAAPAPLHITPSPSPSPGGRAPIALSPARQPLAHLRGITRDAYTGGDVLPSLSRVRVSRADVRAKQLRYEDDADEDVFRTRMDKRRRLELIAAVQDYVLQIEDLAAKTARVAKEEMDGQSDAKSGVHVKSEPGVAETTTAKPMPVVKQELPSVSPASSHQRLSVRGREVIDVDSLMEERGAEEEVGSPLLHELLAVVSELNAETGEDAVKTEAVRTGAQRQEQRSKQKAKTTRKRGRSVDGVGSVKEEDHNEGSQTALWARAERIVVQHPDLLVNLDVEVIPGIRLSKAIFDNLLDYQQKGIRWLLQLHGQRTGGILGDEMGLGKTIQIAAMINALHGSVQLRGPVLIVAPMTVLRQWVAELHRWAPYVRSCVMHDSAGDHSHRSRESLIRSVRGTPAVVITTYATLRTHCELLHSAGFQYLIVDEGHKLGNPEAAVTLAAKSFPTPHRLVLSGSPIQNSLKELWCLFDFVRPGLLGTMSRFVDEFEAPIAQSKSVRASPLALATAIESAKTLQEHIAPYLLRRLKRHVNASLPPKVERVIRVPLSDEQLAQYIDIVSSPTVQRLFSQTLYYPQLDGGPLSRDNRDSTGSLHVAGRRFNLKDSRRRNTAGARLESFRVMNQLRQVCNHADIYAVHKGDHFGGTEEMQVVRDKTPHNGDGARSFRSNNPVNMNGSAKLCALQQMLREWYRFGHRVLVFSQTRMMLDIIENLCEQENHRYIRLDGTTSSHYRQELIDRFNGDSSIFIALLTTRVGGVGVNLIGADRVVIFDPDWNPVTDIQARERAWRIGQTREVCVYRMITSGTVEEVILRRQLAKTYVTDKVLRDPTLQRFFHVQDSFVENFLLGQEYAARVPMGKKHVLGGLGGDTSFSHRARTASRARPAVTASAGTSLFADDADGEQERELLRDDVNDAPASPAGSTAPLAHLPISHSQVGRNSRTEEEFGVVVRVSDADAVDADAGEADTSSDTGETSLLKKLMDGQDVNIDGRDAVSRSLARAKARAMMQRVAEDGRGRDAEAQRREFSLLWAAQKKREKDLADRAEQRKYFEEDMARKRQGR